jgi:hypothetical protein
MYAARRLASGRLTPFKLRKKLRAERAARRLLVVGLITTVDFFGIHEVKGSAEAGDMLAAASRQGSAR